MTIIKPKYTFKIVDKVYEKEIARALKSPFKWIIDFVVLIEIFVAIYTAFLFLKKYVEVLNGLSEKLELYEFVFSMLIIFVLFLCVFDIALQLLFLVNNGMMKFSEKNGLIVRNRLKEDEEFKRLRRVYSNIGNLLKEYPEYVLQESELYKIDSGVEIHIKDRCFIIKCILQLEGYEEEMCKEDCFDFSILDRKLEDIIRSHGIDEAWLIE